MNAVEAHKYASRALRKNEPQPGALLAAAIQCFAVAIGLLVLLFIANCGTTTLQKIDAANTAASGLTKVVRPIMDTSCRARAVECKKAGSPKLEACEPWTKCNNLRAGYYAAVNGVHLLAASSSMLVVLGKETELPEVLRRCLKALDTARKAATAAGWL